MPQVEIHRFYSTSVKSCHTDRRSRHDAMCQTMQFYLWSCSQHPAPALQLSGWAGQLILPDNVPSENTSQGKKELLAALNQEYFDQFSSPNHFIQGSDDAAKTVFLYLKQYSGDDINKAVEALTENPKDDRANCADDVLRIISPSPSETYWVSYSFLSADMLEDGVLKENAAFGSVAKDLIGHRRFLVLSEAFHPAASQNAGFAVGVIGGQALVVAVFVS